MSKNRLIALFAAALLIVAAVSAVGYVRSSMQAAEPPAANEPGLVQPDLQESSVLAIPSTAAARSVFVSEAELQQRIEEAAEHRWDARAQELLRIFNKRHEHRCCQLPR